MSSTISADVQNNAILSVNLQVNTKSETYVRRDIQRKVERHLWLYFKRWKTTRCLTGAKRKMTNFQEYSRL